MPTRLQTTLRSLPQWQRTLWVIFFAQIGAAMGFSIIFPFLPLYVEDLGTHTGLSIEFWVGMVFSAQAVTMMIASPIWGGIADRYGRKLMLQRAMFGGTVLIAMMAFVRSAEELVLLRAIQGAITGTVAAANALVAASAPRERMGYAMGVTQVGLWGGIAIGPLIGGVLADQFGYRVPFLVTAGLLFIAGVLVTTMVHEEISTETKTANKRRGFVQDWRQIISGDGVRQTYSVSFLTALGRGMITPMMPLFMVYLLTHGMNETITLPIPAMFAGVFDGGAGVSTMTGLALGLASGTATISAVLLGRLGDRIGHRIIVVGSGIAAMLFYIPQGFVGNAWQLVILQALSGLAVGGLVASPSALLARYTQPGEEGAVYGIENSVKAGARSIAPLMGAGLAVWLGLRLMISSVCVTFLVIAVVAVVLLPDEHAARSAKRWPRLNLKAKTATSAAD